MFSLWSENKEFTVQLFICTCLHYYSTNIVIWTRTNNIYLKQQEKLTGWGTNSTSIGMQSKCSMKLMHSLHLKLMGILLNILMKHNKYYAKHAKQIKNDSCSEHMQLKTYFKVWLQKVYVYGYINLYYFFSRGLQKNAKMHDRFFLCFIILR